MRNVCFLKIPSVWNNQPLSLQAWLWVACHVSAVICKGQCFSFLLFKQPFKIHSNQPSYIWLPCGNTRTHPLVSVVCHWLEEIFIPGCIWNIHQHLKMSKCFQMVRVNVQMTCLLVVTDVVMLVWWPTWWCSHWVYTSSSRRPAVMFAEGILLLGLPD